MEIEYLPQSKFILKIEKIGGGELGDILNDTTGFRVDFTIVSSVIFVICFVFLAVLYFSSMLIRRKINRRNYIGARKVALFYRIFLVRLKRDAVSLTIALLYLLEGERERANDSFDEIKSPQFVAAKNYWRVIEAYIYDASEVEAKISAFELSDRATARGLLTYPDYRARLNLIKRYRETKDSAVLSELESLIKSDSHLQTDLIMKAVKEDYILR